MMILFCWAFFFDVCFTFVCLVALRGILESPFYNTGLYICNYKLFCCIFMPQDILIFLELILFFSAHQYSYSGSK